MIPVYITEYIYTLLENSMFLEVCATRKLKSPDLFRSSRRVSRIITSYRRVQQVTATVESSTSDHSSKTDFYELNPNRSSIRQQRNAVSAKTRISASICKCSRVFAAGSRESTHATAYALRLSLISSARVARRGESSTPTWLVRSDGVDPTEGAEAREKVLLGVYKARRRESAGVQRWCARFGRKVATGGTGRLFTQPDDAPCHADRTRRDRTNHLHKRQCILEEDATTATLLSQLIHPDTLHRTRLYPPRMLN